MIPGGCLMHSTNSVMSAEQDIQSPPAPRCVLRRKAVLLCSHLCRHWAFSPASARLRLFATSLTASNLEAVVFLRSSSTCANPLWHHSQQGASDASATHVAATHTAASHTRLRACHWPSTTPSRARPGQASQPVRALITLGHAPFACCWSASWQWGCLAKTAHQQISTIQPPFSHKSPGPPASGACGHFERSRRGICGCGRYRRPG